MFVDIGAHDTFVTSSNCTICCHGGSRYDSELLSTFQTNGAESSVDLGNGWIHATGSVSRDTFSIGSLSLPNQIFLNAPKFEPTGNAWDNMCIVHAVLGLAPSSRGSVLGSSSPFKHLVEENLLAKKQFGLRLREPAELHIGGTSQPEEEFKWVPL
jgi:hypothetical protein